MELSAQTIELIQKTAVRADGANVFQPKAEPAHVYYLKRPDGSAERIEAVLSPTTVELFTLEDFIKFVPNWRPDDKSHRQVFCGRGLVECVIGANRERNRVLLNLPRSKEFETLMGLEKKREELEHRDFMRLLRVTLAGCVDRADAATFETLKLTSTGGAESTMATGRETTGKRLQMELAANGKPVPTELVVVAPVYRDLVGEGYQRNVVCAVDTNLQDGTFTLSPLAGAVEAAVRETDAMIRKALADGLAAEAEVFAGRTFLVE